MQEEIASTAGIIWHALNDRGELSRGEAQKRGERQDTRF